ncbi:gamma-glutamylcyclotransferase family protein [Streptomyces corynorhini]|uniref:Gamma-glutamylcyclotransferase n=1 Tax=Streptomyces corynorhini TaxID=2282652 RepID=A0A370B6N0_9ACTN|nr:gamma-glutamylcyclotransferase family protein [Streptomyces corynorhini]RDG35406.1 gamma-glutamylcyclotransferase [Streptomyces corynorhini]
MSTPRERTNDHVPVLPFFVYGTLRPGGHYHDRFLTGRTVREEPALLAGALLYDGPGYPYAIETTQTTETTETTEMPRVTRVPGAPGTVETSGTVVGELVTPAPAHYGQLLAALDELEGFLGPGHPGNLYDRVVRDIRRADSTTAAAWVYVAAPRVARLLRADGRPIPGGDWNRHGRR